MPGSCKRLFEEYLRCIEQSECVRRRKLKPHECYEEGPQAVPECEGPRDAYSKVALGNTPSLSLSLS